MSSLKMVSEVSVAQRGCYVLPPVCNFVYFKLHVILDLTLKATMHMDLDRSATPGGSSLLSTITSCFSF